MYAPYFESWDSADGSLAQLSAASGARYLTLAFLQTDQPGSCDAYWNGSTATPISATAAGSFGADIAAVQAKGGNVIPSFGGYTADTTGTELADSCTSVDAIAKVYESLITTYHVPRIDLDIEQNSLSDTAAIQRRNEAIAETEAWAAQHGKHIQFSYTLPTFADRPAGGRARRAAERGRRGREDLHGQHHDLRLLATARPQNMLNDAETAATAAHGQLASLYPGLSSRALWEMIGVTQMQGIDDFGTDETFTTAQAPAFAIWAAIHGLGEISMWALQRDNGNCPGTKGAGSCSGVAQPAWYYSHVFEPFSYLP